jgi:hypothetical protein
MTTMHSSNGITANMSPGWFSGFRLEMQEGMKTVYAHMCGLDKTTTDIRYAWVGTRDQVRNVRRLYPDTKRMKIVRHDAKDALRPYPSGY